MKELERPFAVFDIDGTLIRWQLYHAIVNELAKQGSLEAKDYEAVRGARMLWKQRTHEESFKEYEIRLIRAFEDLLAKLTGKQFDAAASNVFFEYKDQVYSYTRSLIKELKSKGYFLIAISGSQAEIIGKIAGYYGFDDFTGSVYHRKGNRFTGERTTTLGSKDKVLRSFITKHGLSLKDSIAVGDSKSDETMLKMVEKPIAFNPDKELFQIAQKNNWPIVIERKNMIYRLEAQNGQYVLI